MIMVGAKSEQSQDETPFSLSIEIQDKKAKPSNVNAYPVSSLDGIFLFHIFSMMRELIADWKAGSPEPYSCAVPCPA